MESGARNRKIDFHSCPIRTLALLSKKRIGPEVGRAYFIAYSKVRMPRRRAYQFPRVSLGPRIFAEVHAHKGRM